MQPINIFQPTSASGR